MSNLFSFLSINLSAGILVVLTIIVKKIFQKKLSLTWQYYIWLIILTKLMFPFSLHINFMDYLFNNSSLPGNIYEYTNNVNSDRLITKANKVISLSPEYAVINLILSVYYIVVLILLVYKLVSYIKQIIQIKKTCNNIFDKKTLDLYEYAADSLGIKKKPPLFISSDIGTPMMMGVFSPTIILQNCQYDENELLLILKHELLHFKRKDPLYKWIAYFVYCIYWFNPLVKYIYKDINIFCELSLDEQITHRYDKSSIFEYGTMLLNNAAPKTITKISLLNFGISVDAQFLKERLSTLVERKTNIYNKKMSISLIAVLLVIATTLGACMSPKAQVILVETIPEGKTIYTFHKPDANTFLYQEDAMLNIPKDTNLYFNISNDSEKGNITVEFVSMKSGAIIYSVTVNNDSDDIKQMINVPSGDYKIITKTKYLNHGNFTVKLITSEQG